MVILVLQIYKREGMRYWFGDEFYEEISGDLVIVDDKG